MTSVLTVNSGFKPATPEWYWSICSNYWNPCNVPLHIFRKTQIRNTGLKISVDFSQFRNNDAMVEIGIELNVELW